MTMNASLFEFLDACRWGFRFLVDLGFHEEELPPVSNVNAFQMRYVSANTRVVIEGIQWGQGVNLLVGPIDGELYGFGHLLSLQAPRDLEGYTEAEGQLAKIEYWAEMLQKHGQRLLDCDLRVIADVAREQQRYLETYQAAQAAAT
jgi:hypothetical protein